MEAMSAELAEERTRRSGVERVASAPERWMRQKNKQRERVLVAPEALSDWRIWRAADEKVLEETCPIRQRKLPNFAMSVLLDFSEPMEAPFSEVHLDTAYGLHATEVDPVKDIQEKVHRLYSALVQMKEGEANDIACNSPSICLEARRKLACRQDPLTGGRTRKLSRSAINPGRAILPELQGAVERKERQVRRETERAGRNRGLLDILRAGPLTWVPFPHELFKVLHVNEVMVRAEHRTGARLRESRVQRHHAARDGPTDVDALLRSRGKGADDRCAEHRQEMQESSGGTEKAKVKARAKVSTLYQAIRGMEILWVTTEIGENLTIVKFGMQPMSGGTRDTTGTGTRCRYNSEVRRNAGPDESA